jgi:nucleoside-diphosphate-sugar epimerase
MSNGGDVDVAVTGAGGFIGGHLVDRLLRDGLSVRGIDNKPLAEWHQLHAQATSEQRDLSQREQAQAALHGARLVYHLAADMGGMGYIATHRGECMLSVLIDTHVLLAARDLDVQRLFYASSACVYSTEKQSDANVTALREDDAYPAQPEDGYGWQKLFSERLCRHFEEDFGIETRVARYHNVHGPYGTWEGGREKAPAAICRKVALAALTGGNEIEVWGDGRQTRSFMYIDDCIEGTRRVMEGEYGGPVNVGSAELVSINQLVDVVEEIGGVSLARRYKPDAPLGVRGRNSDNALMRSRYGWEPSVSLRTGMEQTYRWVYGQVEAQLATGAAAGVPPARGAATKANVPSRP